VLGVAVDVTCAISALDALANMMNTSGKRVFAHATFIRDPEIVVLLRMIALNA
jgi:hypothetical protein